MEEPKKGSDPFSLKAGSVEIPLSEISESFARSGGPGGQNVNKVETKVEVRFTPRTSSALVPGQVTRIEEKLGSRMTKDGEIIVTSELTRHREQNREDALRKLAALISEALRIQKRRKKTRPTRASKERRLNEKKQRGDRKRMRRPPRDD